MESEARSYAFSFRPKYGLTPSLKSELLKYCKKLKYALLIYEKEGEACHAHGQVFYSSPKNKFTLDRYLDRLLKKQKVEYIKKYAINIKPAYNDDWCNKYLLNNASKVDDKSEVAYKNMPSDTSDYYPTQEQQEQFQNAAKLKKIQYNERITNLVKKFKKSKFAIYEKPEAIAIFLHNLTFIENEAQIPKDNRCRRNLQEQVWYSLIGKKASYKDIVTEWGHATYEHDIENHLETDTSKICQHPFMFDGCLPDYIQHLMEIHANDEPLYIDT